jgi:hypothetical protein
MKQIMAVLLLLGMARGQERHGAYPAMERWHLADAPSTVKEEKEKEKEKEKDPLPREKAGFWAGENPGGSDIPLRTNREVWTSKSFVLSEAGYLGAVVFDVEATHQGLAHHRCVERNGDDPHPSRGELYRNALPEYGFSLVFGWLMSHYVWQPLVFELPAIGTVTHVRGGARWLENCW